ncbi:MAG TPA: hypothetical protein VNW47_14890 [Terriglobales bacterium]|jgi:hypothetical protein|nr:hypothetical protein [Terriglobales bacterium]
MTDRSWIEPIVERVVTQVLESHTAQLRTEIVQRVMEEIAAQPAPEPPAPAGANTAELARAVAEIQLGSSQKEILKALLDSCGHYAARVALFVVKGSNATGWQGRGFNNNDGVKDFTLDAHAEAVMQAIGDRAPVSAPASEFDARFIQDFGAPASGEGRLLPLVLKDKVAALVYADCGSESAGKLDAGSLELLVLSTSAWLEVNSLRKLAHKEPSADRSENRPAAVAEAAPPFNDPFASHAPTHAMAAAAAMANTPAAVMSAVAEAEPAVMETVVEELAPATEVATEVPASAPAMSPEDQDVHRKAQRFARLLVDEVKLYNQAKVAEGRKHKDLYDRLKEAIEKSRGTYQKRYGNTVAASGDYFQHELVRSLAEDDVSIMGANFRH